MSNRCLILTEAGQGIGFGHLARCTAILDCLRSQSNSEQHRLFLDVHGELEVNHAGIQPAQWLESYQNLVIHNLKFDLALVDSYLASPQVYAYLSKHFKHVVAIDDYYRIEYKNVRAIINPNAYFQSSLENLAGDSRRVGGKDFVILRGALHPFRDKLSVQPTLKKIVLTLGGDDVRKLAPRIIKLIPLEIELTVVAGSDRYRKELNDVVQRDKLEIHGFFDATTMAELMSNSDLAISACGQTLNELAFLGVPSIGICIAHDQVRNMQFFAEQGFIQGQLSWDDPQLDQKLLDTIQQYRPFETRLEKHQIGKKIVDGRGVQNICELLLELE